MDGLQAVRAVRGHERLLHLPVIAATANALPGGRERFLAAGMSDYLAKPIEDEELRRVLSRWLRVVPGRLDDCRGRGRAPRFAPKASSSGSTPRT